MVRIRVGYNNSESIELNFPGRRSMSIRFSDISPLLPPGSHIHGWVPIKQPNNHEWGVVAQIHEPSYREFCHCCLCGRFVESEPNAPLLSVFQFNQICKDNKVYEADSNTRLLSWKPYVAKEDE